MAKKLTQNINKDKVFNDEPVVKPDLSSWLTRHTNYQDSNLGEIIPIYWDEVLPDEEREITMSMISHTTTPIAPIFNSMYTEIRAFVVPMRLCTDLLNGYKTRKSPFVKVFGEDNENANAKVIVPLAQQALPSFTSSHRFIQDVNSYISNADTQRNVFDSLDLIDPLAGTANDASFLMNYLNLAAYELIYQRHYRNENYEAATSSALYRLLFDAYNSSKSSVTLDDSFTYEIANREKDYFTGMKPFTQKGDPVRVSLTGEAPVVTGDVVPSMAAEYKTSRVYALDDVPAVKFGFSGVDDSTVGNLQTSNIFIGARSDSGYESEGFAANGQADGNNVTSFNLHKIAPVNLWADLSSVQGISIEELRLLIKTQELLEKDAMYGSLYAESLNAHFGCCPLDLTLQDPQELYRTTITSNMQAIFQTSSTSGESSILGTIGANSTTQTDPFVILPNTKFKEHSILMICAVHKLQNVYDASYFKPKFIYKRSRFDFFTPELNDLGYQPVSKKEMRTNTGSVAGFNEAFAEYRYKFNKVHGTLASQFPYWAPAISNEYSSAAYLYKEDPVILDKSLSVTSTDAPQFYDAWGFEEKNTKPMSLHAIPGFDGVI